MVKSRLKITLEMDEEEISMVYSGTGSGTCWSDPDSELLEIWIRKFLKGESCQIWD
jgi:hypothetical protein